MTSAEMQNETTLADQKTYAEIAKLIAETSKINSENRFCPFIVGATVTLAIVAVVKIFV